jgi:flotillin
MFGLEPLLLAMGAMCLVVILILNFWLVSMYHRCPPNAAMIVSGAGLEGAKFRIYTSGGAIVLPLFQTLSHLSLEVYPVEVNSNAPFLSKDGKPLSIGGVAQFKVRGDDVSIATAAETLLGKTPEEITAIVQQSITGHMRALAGTMTMQELIQGLDSLAVKVKEASLPDLNNFGLTISSFTINELKPLTAGLAS